MVRRGLEPVDSEVAQQRLLALQDLQHAHTLDFHQSRVGDLTTILVEGPTSLARRAQTSARRRSGGGSGEPGATPSRRPGAGEPRMGRCPYNRVVNLAAGAPEAGSFARVRISGATPHSLLGEVLLGEVPPGEIEAGLELPLVQGGAR